SRFLSLGNERPIAGRCKKTADAGATGAYTLCECPLRHELHRELAREKLALEFLVLSDVSGNHLADLARLQQHADAEVVHARVVADDGEVPGPPSAQRRNEPLGNAAQPEAAHHDRGAVGNERDRLLGAREHFVHRRPFYQVRSHPQCIQTSKKPSAFTSRSSLKEAKRSSATIPPRPW